MEKSSYVNTPMKVSARNHTETPLKRVRRQSNQVVQSPYKAPDSGTDDDDDDVEVEAVEMDSGSIAMSYFQENPDMHSQQIPEFKTPKKNHEMLAKAKAQNTPKTPKLLNSLSYETPTRKIQPKTPSTPKTPKSTMKVKLNEPKTPSQYRSKLKKGLERKCRDDDEDDDFDGDSSDEYAPSESSESEDISDVEVNSSSSEDCSSSAKIVPAKRSIIKPTRNTRNSKIQQQDLVFESDKYFGKTNKKNATSNNTLDCLKTPRLQHEELFKLLSTMEPSIKHQQCIKEMQCQYETLFPKWLLILKEGYNIVLYGLGSKRNILQQLHSTHLANENVLVVNGYFPSLTVKDILENIATDLLDMTCKSHDLHETVDAIEKEMKLTPEYSIFLIIHNLEGAMLRNALAQTVLSRLAHIPNIHLIASIDHINTPHLWDSIHLSNYNFSWWDATSFMPYTDETSVVENSMLVKNSGALAISSMKSVFLSLTSNARGIYMIIVKNQLANNRNSNFQGMPFKALYRKCLEAFLVSSDIVLRTQLTEFCDHNLLKFKRSADGTEQLKIPVDNILLQQFVEQHDN